MARSAAASFVNLTEAGVKAAETEAEQAAEKEKGGMGPGTRNAPNLQRVSRKDRNERNQNTMSYEKKQ